MKDIKKLIGHFESISKLHEKDGNETDDGYLSGSGYYSEDSEHIDKDDISLEDFLQQMITKVLKC